MKIAKRAASCEDTNAVAGADGTDGGAHLVPAIGGAGGQRHLTCGEDAAVALDGDAQGALGPAVGAEGKRASPLDAAAATNDSLLPSGTIRPASKRRRPSGSASTAPITQPPRGPGKA